MCCSTPSTPTRSKHRRGTRCRGLGAHVLRERLGDGVGALLALYPTRILLATDGSEESASAVRTAVELANSTGSELYVVHAISTAPQRPYPRHFERAKSEDILQSKRVTALVLLDEKVRQAEKMGGIVVNSYYREGDPVKEVLRLAEELDVGLIITGGR